MQRPQGGVWGIAVGCEVAMKGVWFTRDVDRSIGKLGRAGRGEHAHALLFSDLLWQRSKGSNPTASFSQRGVKGRLRWWTYKPPPPVQSRHAGMPSHYPADGHVAECLLRAKQLSHTALPSCIRKIEHIPAMVQLVEHVIVFSSSNQKFMVRFRLAGLFPPLFDAVHITQ